MRMTYILKYCKGVKIQQEPEFGALKYYRKAHGSLLHVSGEMLCNYTVCCWPTTSSSAIVEGRFLCRHVGSIKFHPDSNNCQQSNGQEINAVMVRPKSKLRVALA